MLADAPRLPAGRYLGIIDRVRAAIPDAAITTDIIVGFPGETEADFEQTLEVVRQARFASAFTFQYSKRPGTPAAEMDGPGAQGRRPGALLRLVALQDEITWAENHASRSAAPSSCSSPWARASGRRDRPACPAAPATAPRALHARHDGVRPGDVVETA